MITPKFTPWVAAQSPTDAEMYCVRGAYLVADCLPIEDARLIAAAPELYAMMRELLELHIAHHNNPAHGKARALIGSIDHD